MNYRIIICIIGKVLMFESLFMAPALLTAFIYREKSGFAILISMIICALAGCILSKKKYTRKAMYAREGFVAVALCWIVLSAFGALPFVISKEIPSFVDALFE